MVFKDETAQDTPIPSLAGAASAPGSAGAASASGSAGAVSAPPTPAQHPGNAAPSRHAREIFLDPLALYQRLEGPNRSVTLINSLPSACMRMFVLHAQEIDRKIYGGEITGALSANPVKKMRSIFLFAELAR